jgi:hypothetical protein
MGNDNCFGTEDPTLQYIESATSRPDLFNPGDQTTEITQYPDPTRFHSFDVSPYQSGRSQHVTVLL